MAKKKRPAAPKRPKTAGRAHKWALLPLGFRVTREYRADNPPPDCSRKCASCGLVQTAAPAAWGAKVNWPKCGPCAGQ